MIDQAVAVLLWVFDLVVGFYYITAIIHIILSWLVAFNILDTNHQLVGRFIDFINRIINPIYDWIYQFLRPIGGGIIAMFDFRPLLFIFFLYFFQPMVHALVYKLVDFLG